MRFINLVHKPTRCRTPRENGRVKLRYIGYGRKYDEWRKADDIIDLNENDNSDEKVSLLLGGYQLQLLKFCLRN